MEEWSVTGLVVPGEQRGRELGFPTANVQLPDHAVMPADGVFAGWARIGAEPAGFRAAAISLGTNPTFDGSTRTLEVHLLDFDGDLYGQQLEVLVVHRLREMERYPELESLVAAIRRDVQNTRSLLASKPGSIRTTASPFHRRITGKEPDMASSRVEVGTVDPSPLLVATADARRTSPRATRGGTRDTLIDPESPHD